MFFHVLPAYGLVTAFQNGGLALFPFIVGQILNKCNNDPPSSAADILPEDTFNECQDSLDQFKYTEVRFFLIFVVSRVGVGVGEECLNFEIILRVG